MKASVPSRTLTTALLLAFSLGTELEYCVGISHHPNIPRTDVPPPHTHCTLVVQGDPGKPLSAWVSAKDERGSWVGETGVGIRHSC